MLPVVRKAEKLITENDTLNHEYLPVQGLDLFTNSSVSLLLGKDSPAIAEKRAFGVQSLSGTGALRIGASFLSTILKKTTFYFSDPTWENHRKVFLDAGFTTPKTYRYWDASKRALNFEGKLQKTILSSKHLLLNFV